MKSFKQWAEGTQQNHPAVAQDPGLARAEQVVETSLNNLSMYLPTLFKATGNTSFQKMTKAVQQMKTMFAQYTLQSAPPPKPSTPPQVPASSKPKFGSAVSPNYFQNSGLDYNNVDIG